MRKFEFIAKLVLMVVALSSLLTGCVVVERPYRYHHGYYYGERYHDCDGRYCR